MSPRTRRTLILSTLLVAMNLAAFGQNFWQAASIPAVTAGVSGIGFTSGGNMFASTVGSGIYKSTDDGSTWTQQNTGSVLYYYCLTVSPGGTIFAGSYLGTVSRSTDNGSTWTSAKVSDAASADSANSIVFSVAFDAAGNTYVSTGLDGIYLSSDNGASWQSVNTSLPYPSSMGFDSKKNFYVGTYGDGLFTSPSATGSAWTPAAFSVFFSYRVRVDMRLVIDSAATDTVHLITTHTRITHLDSVIYDSSRYGSYSVVHQRESDTTTLQVDSITFAVLAVKTDSISYLDTSRTTFFGNLSDRDYLRVNTMVFGTNDFVGTDKGVFRRFITIDSSVSRTNPDTIPFWREVSYPLGYKYVLSLVETPSGAVYAGTYGDGVIASNDGGASWSKVDTGVVFKKARTILALGPSGHLYCGSFNGGVYKSINTVSVESPIAPPPARTVSPAPFVLEQGYPNPFNPSATIPFVLFKSGQVTLKVYNAIGQQVATLHDGPMSAGDYRMTWNASDFPSGVYFYRMQAASEIQTGKLILMK